jgi:hypothetical protein
MAKGYGDAMALGFNAVEMSLAVIALAAMAVIGIAASTRSRSYDRIVMAGLVLIGTFVTWKAAMVRQDSAHSFIFFAFVSVAPFVITGKGGAADARLRVIAKTRYVCVITAIVGLFACSGDRYYTPRNFLPSWSKRVVGNVRTLLDLPGFKAARDSEVKTLSHDYDLPNIRAAVGAAPVDIFSWSQGVLFLNNLSWRPRPVFQSYAAFTPTLGAINRDFYASEHAPDFVVLRMQTVDRQLPSMNDSEAFQLLLRDYRPVLAEKGYILLRRAPRGQGPVAAGTVLLRNEVAFNERIDVGTFNSRQLLLRLQIRKSWLGHLMSLAYKLVPPMLEIETAGGATDRYRIIAGTSQAGFVLNPLILTQSDLAGWFTDSPVPRVSSLRLTLRSGAMRYFFKPEISVEIAEFGVTPHSLDEPVKQNLRENVRSTFLPSQH